MGSEADVARQGDVGCKDEIRTFLAKNSLGAIFGTIRRNSPEISKVISREEDQEFDSLSSQPSYLRRRAALFAAGLTGLAMLELHHYEPYANSMKCLICLEEKGLAFTSRYVDILRFEQHAAAFLKINPNGQVPVLVHDSKTIVESLRHQRISR